MKSLLTVVLILLFASSVNAATKGRIITDGKVSMFRNGKLVDSFTQQGPIDDSSLIACEGNCLVKIKSISLIASDQTKLAVKEVDQSVNLYVETGRVDFALADVSKELAFITADGLYLKTEGFVTAASTNNSVKGYMQVTDKGTEIGMEKGTMIIDNQEIGPGQAILLAQIPPEQAVNNTNDDDDDKAAIIPPCTIFNLGNCTAIELTGLGVAASAFGYGAYHLYNNAIDKDTKSFTAPSEDTPSASPNQ